MSVDQAISALGLGLGVFAVTDIDDLLVLLGFFGDPGYRPWQIMTGHFVGIAVLYVFSLAASFVSLLIPASWIGLLGLAPVLIGLATLLSPKRFRSEVTGGSASGHGGARGGMATVAIVTVANGGDNIASYTPLFATRSGQEIAVMGVAFALMAALWGGAAQWMVRHPTIGVPLRRAGARALPYLLVGLGLLILWRSRSFALLGWQS